MQSHRVRRLQRSVDGQLLHAVEETSSAATGGEPQSIVRYGHCMAIVPSTGGAVSLHEPANAGDDRFPVIPLRTEHVVLAQWCLVALRDRACGVAATASTDQYGSVWFGWSETPSQPQMVSTDPDAARPRWSATHTPSQKPSLASTDPNPALPAWPGTPPPQQNPSPAAMASDPWVTMPVSDALAQKDNIESEMSLPPNWSVQKRNERDDHIISMFTDERLDYTILDETPRGDEFRIPFTKDWVARVRSLRIAFPLPQFVIQGLLDRTFPDLRHLRCRVRDVAENLVPDAVPALWPRMQHLVVREDGMTERDKPQAHRTVWLMLKAAREAPLRTLHLGLNCRTLDPECYRTHFKSILFSRAASSVDVCIRLGSNPKRYENKTPRSVTILRHWIDLVQNMFPATCALQLHLDIAQHGEQVTEDAAVFGTARNVHFWLTHRSVSRSGSVVVRDVEDTRQKIRDCPIVAGPGGHGQTCLVEDW